MALLIPGSDSVISAGQYPHLKVEVNNVEGGTEMVITTPKLGNIVKITCSSYSSSTQTDNHSGIGSGITTTNTIYCHIDRVALTQMVKTHSLRHFPAMGDQMPKGLETVLTCITSFSEATQRMGARAGDAAVSTALVVMLSVLEEMSANIDSGAKYLVSEKTNKKANTAITHPRFVAAVTPRVSSHTCEPAARPAPKAQLPVTVSEPVWVSDEDLIGWNEIPAAAAPKAAPKSANWWENVPAHVYSSPQLPVTVRPRSNNPFW